jgi:carbon storage regulator CsrA
MWSSTQHDSLPPHSIGSSTVEQTLGHPEALVEGSTPSRSAVFGSWQGLSRLGSETSESSTVSVLKRRGSDVGIKEAGGPERTDQHQELPELRSTVQTEMQDQSDMPTKPVPPEAVQALDVHRSDQPSQQTRSRRGTQVRLKGLCLTRSPGEMVNCLTSDGEIKILVVRLTQGRVRLLFSAPKEIRVHRSELVKKESSL